MRRLALLALVLLACRPAPDLAVSLDPATARRGDVASVERIDGCPSSWLAKALVCGAGLSARLPVEHGTTLYRVGPALAGGVDGLIDTKPV